MKTEKEVQEYLKDKVYSSEEAIFIIGFLCGKRLKPVLQEMFKWGIDYVEEFGENTGENDCQAEACFKN